MAMNMNEISNDALKLWKIKRKFRKAKSGHGWTNIGEDITDCHLGNNHKKKKKQSPACSKFISSSLKVWVITFRLHVAVIFTPRPRLFVTLPLKSYIARIPLK